MIPAFHLYDTLILDLILHQEKAKLEVQRGYDTLKPPTKCQRALDIKI